MNDFNRIAYLVKNYGKLRGLYFFATGLFYSLQVLTPLQIDGLYEYFPLVMFGALVIPVFLLWLVYRYYKNSVGVVTNYKNKMSSRDKWLIFSFLGFFLLGTFASLALKLWLFPFSLYFIGLLLLFPSLKENWTYRRYIFWIAGVIFIANYFPFSQFYSFKYDFSESGLKNGIFILLFFVPTGLFDHFLLLKLMRPIGAESIKNSPASADPVLGDPANLTILAALANCQNADFVFLRKISRLEETEFYRRIYGLTNGGLLYTFQQPNGIYKGRLVAAITPLGWQVVTRIYNDVIPAQALPFPGANPIY
jgi:hypothetical protein